MRFDERHAWKRVTHINYLLTNLLLKPTRKEDIMVYTLAQKTLGAIKREKSPSNPTKRGSFKHDGRADRRFSLARQIRPEETPSKNMIKRDRKERKRHSLTHDRLHLGQIREHTRPFKMH